MLNPTRQIRGSLSHVMMLTASPRFRLLGKRGLCTEAASVADVVGMQFYKGLQPRPLWQGVYCVKRPHTRHDTLNEAMP